MILPINLSFCQLFTPYTSPYQPINYQPSLASFFCRFQINRHRPPLFINHKIGTLWAIMNSNNA